MKFITLLVAVMVLAACGARSSDEEEIHALLAQAEAAAEARDSSEVLALVADDYADSRGFDKSGLRDFLRAYFLMNPKIELLVDVDGLAFPAAGLAQADVTVTSLAGRGADRERLRVEFRRYGGEWRVARADRARE
jgi:hypothetical protein